MSLNQIIKDRILILDGPISPMIPEYSLKEADFVGKNINGRLHKELSGNTSFLSLTQPALIKRIHGKYLEAGADIIKTNSLNANFIIKYGRDMDELIHTINRQSALIAREIADKYSTQNKPRFVAGVLGPAGKTLNGSRTLKYTDRQDFDYDTLVEVYTLQARSLLEGGVDMFLIETIIDSQSLKAALAAIEKVNLHHLPVTIAVTPTDQNGRTLTGKKLETFLNSIAHHRIFSVGINCPFGIKSLLPIIRRLSARSPFYVVTHLSTGLPNENTANNLSTHRINGDAERLFKEGLVNIAGGCYNSHPGHIETIADTAQKYKPRKKPVNPVRSEIRGLKNLNETGQSLRTNKQVKEAQGTKSLPTHVSLEEARQKVFVPNRSADKQHSEMLGVKVFDDYSLHILRDYIDWTPFFHGWGMKGKYPEILEDEKKGKEANRIFREANQLLEKII
ncbi:MAG: homocysteine S-methyltransferase family protein, partial [Bacteroidales bacterium]|nr:homocysteine S-methyltransferase family protein [Bacteroidales bacterium]